MKKYYNEGDLCYFDGLELEDCPYDKGTYAYKSWREGWKTAKEISSEENRDFVIEMLGDKVNI